MDLKGDVGVSSDLIKGLESQNGCTIPEGGCNYTPGNISRLGDISKEDRSGLTVGNDSGRGDVRTGGRRVEGGRWAGAPQLAHL